MQTKLSLFFPKAERKPKFGTHKKAVIGAIVLLSILATSLTAYGVVRYTAYIQNPVAITVKSFELQLWRVDTNAQVTSIPWGNIDTGTQKDSDQAFNFSAQLVIKNVGGYWAYAAWQLNGTLPANVTLIGQYCNAGVYEAWNQSDFSVISKIAPNGGISGPVKWFLTIPSGASAGTFNFTINLLGADSSSG